MNSTFLFKPKHRTAFTMTEMIVAMAITRAIMVGGAQLMTFTARHGREVENRRLAATEAGNVMEQLMTQPWDTLIPDGPALSELTLSDTCRQVLPDSRLKVTVADDAASQARRITIHIDWATNATHRSPGVRLVAWRYPQQETQP